MDQGYDGQIMSTEAIESDNIFDLAGDSVDGVFFTKSVPPADNPATEAFEQDYRDRFGDSPFVTRPVRGRRRGRPHDPGRARRRSRRGGPGHHPAIQFDSSGDVTTGGYPLWVVNADSEDFGPYTG